MGTPGWIHTAYDNSTSTETFSWVEPEDLEAHIKVAALTIMRVSPDTRSLIDVALLGVASSKTVVGQGYAVSINVTVENQGGYAETFNVTVYANTTSITTQTVTLTSGNSPTVTFTWNTAGFASGNYTISAYAWPVPGETDIADNTLYYDYIVKVTIPGDVNGDFFVNIKDANMLLIWWQQRVPPAPSNVDINGDGIINIKDVNLILSNWLKHA